MRLAPALSAKPFHGRPIGAALIVGACVFGPSGVAIAQTDEPAVAVDVHTARVGNTTELSFDLSRTVTATSYTLENPDRLVIETSALDFKLGPDAGNARAASAGLLKSFRYGPFAAGKSRIVLDLAGPAEVKKLAVVPVAAGDPSRLVVQIGRADRASFHAAAQAAAAMLQAANRVETPVTSEATDHRPVVVIDPGHGGVDPGAQGTGAVEKNITLDFARSLAAKLRASGHFNVVMTREGDAFVSLSDRVKIARDAHAQLFVSVHADTVPDGSGVTGATVYTVSDRASDAQAARLAETENKADEQAGVESAPQASDVSDILFDLTRRETRTFSHSFQRTLVGYWQKIARLNKNPERSAGFMVLKAPDVPSVLLELGYLSSQADVEAMASPAWRESATGSVAKSIESFFANRDHDRPAGAQMAAAPTGPDTPIVVTVKPHL